WFILGIDKGSTQNALNRFFVHFKAAALLTVMTPQAFSLRRQQVKWEAVREVFQTSVKGSYNEELKYWRGAYLLLAVDGSRVALPADAALRAYYGATGHDKSAATAQASILYDVMNDIIVDARLEPLKVDERTLAEKHLEALAALELDLGGRKPLVIFDRGYPSKEFIKYLQENEIKYLMRVRRGFNAQIDSMLEGSKRLELADGIPVRAVVFTLSGGEREALITNLEEEEVEEDAFPKLYYQRWAIETKYNQVKQKLELENFSGRLVDNIKQDFYAMMTVSNLLACGLREANREARRERSVDGVERKYEYQVNVNHAVGVLKDQLVKILIADDSSVRKQLYMELVSEIKRQVVPVRPNRKVKRKEYLKKPHFHHNHKSNC
ncbi:MAG: IS4 family transposase, partial [Spirochaetaceae bacterium]|nr:IS4 family transposase [Spirochaetaceae bacterium]